MKGNFRKSFWFHLIMVFLVFTVLYISFFATLHWITKHGEEVKIPDVRGKNINDAITTLKSLHFEISVDSTYEPAIKALSVLKQVPDTGSMVKEGRTVFLTVNMLTPPHIPMPNLVNLSLRSAEMLLRNNKLLMGDTTYKPDIAAGAILAQSYKGQPINPGEMIPQGSKIGLVIGDGFGNTQFDVPDVRGKTIDEARTILDQYSLQYLIAPASNLEAITDTDAAKVVNQSPAPYNDAMVPNRIKAGDIIDLQIMQNPTENEIHGNNRAPRDVMDDDKTKKK